MSKNIVPTNKTLLSELRITLAIMKKAMLNWVRYPTWILLVVFYPLVFIARFIYMGKMFVGPQDNFVQRFTENTGTADYVSFMIISGCMMWLLMHSLWGMGSSLRGEQLQGTLEQNWVCPISRFRYLLSISFFDLMVVMSIVGIMLTLGRIFWGFRFQGSVWLLGIILILTLCSIYGFAFMFAALVFAFREPDVLTEAVSSILMILCGIVYPITILPRWVQSISKLLPITWASRDVRAVVLGGYGIRELSNDLLVLGIFAVIMPLLGYLAFSYVERRTRLKGDLGKY